MFRCSKLFAGSTLAILAWIAPVARAQTEPPVDPAVGTVPVFPAELPAPAAAPAAVVAPAGTDDSASDFNRELLTVEENVDDLKERVFRSKATLQLLKEIVIEGASTGARATVWHVNKLGGAYKLESVSYLLDGQSKFSKTDPTGGLNESTEFKVYEGAVPPGNHNLSVDFRVRPTGFGIFKYAQNYEIDVRSNYAFVAELGRQCTVKAILTDRGGAINSFEERAKVDFELKCEKISDAGK